VPYPKNEYFHIFPCFSVTGIFGTFVTAQNDIYKLELRDFQPRTWEKLSENIDRYCLSLILAKVFPYIAT